MAQPNLETPRALVPIPSPPPPISFPPFQPSPGQTNFGVKQSQTAPMSRCDMTRPYFIQRVLPLVVPFVLRFAIPRGRKTKTKKKTKKINIKHNVISSYLAAKHAHAPHRHPHLGWVALAPPLVHWRKRRQRLVGWRRGWWSHRWQGQ